MARHPFGGAIAWRENTYNNAPVIGDKRSYNDVTYAEAGAIASFTATIMPTKTGGNDAN